MKTSPVALEGFQSVTGWFAQILELCRVMQKQKLAARSSV